MYCFAAAQVVRYSNAKGCIRMLALIAHQLVFLIGFILAGYCIGRGALRRFVFVDRAEEFFLATSAGWGAIALMLSLLGFAGLLYPSVIPGSVMAMAALSLKGLKRTSTSPRRPLPAVSGEYAGVSRIIIVLTALYFIFYFYLTLYPVRHWDALSYYLPAAREFLAGHAITPLSYLRYPANPHLLGMLYIFPLVLKNLLFVNIISYAMMLVTTGLIYSFAQRYYGGITGVCAAVIFLSSPLVFELAAAPYPDIPVSLFCFAALYAMIAGMGEAGSRMKNSFLALSGIFLGIACGSKYHAVLFGLIMLVLSPVVSGGRPQGKSILIIPAAAVCVAFPWYMRNKICTGDWFFPLFSRGRDLSGGWEAGDFLRQFMEVQAFGRGRSLKDLFMLPLNMCAHPSMFTGSVGIVHIVFLALSYAFLLRMDRRIAVCAGIMHAYGLVWFNNFQIARYLLPILPLWAITAAWAFKNAAASLKERHVGLLGLAAASLILIFGIAKIRHAADSFGGVPAGEIRTHQYLAQRLSSYAAIQKVNELSVHDAAVYGLFDEQSRFYYSRPALGNWFGADSYEKIFGGTADAFFIARLLKERGVRYIVYNRILQGPHVLVSEKYVRRVINNLCAMVDAGLIKAVYGGAGGYAYVFKIQ